MGPCSAVGACWATSATGAGPCERTRIVSPPRLSAGTVSDIATVLPSARTSRMRKGSPAARPGGMVAVWMRSTGAPMQRARAPGEPQRDRKGSKG